MTLWSFLNTGPYAAGIFNFSHVFHWSPSKRCDNIGYHGKSKCLLECCNEKLVCSTSWYNIFYLKLFKTFLCTGSSLQAECQGPWPSCLCRAPFQWILREKIFKKIPHTFRPKILGQSLAIFEPRQLCWAGFIAMLMCVCVCVCLCVCLLTR